MGATVRGWVGGSLLALSFGLLLLVGLAGPGAAKPPLGPRGWAPGHLVWAPAPALVTGLLWVAYLLGAAGVLLHLASARGHAVRWWLPAGLAVAGLLTAPIGSGDHTVYAAYGRIVASGGDPYLVSPDTALAVGDPVLRFVDAPWSDTVSVYGPLATALQGLTSWLGGDNMRQTVWVWQVLVVLAWLGVRALLLTMTRDRGRVDALWTLNPLVFGVGVLGAHVDMLAAALALAVLAVVSRTALGGGVLMGLTVSTKVTYGLVGAAVLVAWWTVDRSRMVRRAVVFGIAALAVAVPLHVWAGPHVFDQLDRARRSVSLATPWRLALDVLGVSRDLVGVLALVLFVLLTWVLARLTRDLAPATVSGAAVRWALTFTAAYAISAPYSLPWYDLFVWATLPVLAASVLDTVLVLRLASMAVAYVPGRVVAMTPTVEDLTLGVRRNVVPYAALLVWGWLTVAATRVSSRSTVPRPPAP